MYSPTDILDYVIENEYEADFMVSLAHHKGNYTIAEIVDAKYLNKDGEHILKSASYEIRLHIKDEEIIAAINAGKYISSFISRKDAEYQVHFFIHDFNKEDKSEHEEEILKAVIQYMILKTIIKLRLDSPDKIKEYISVR